MIVPEMRTWFARHALSDASDLTKPYLVVLDAPHPETNPPTYFLAAGYDSLVDEGRAYAERLRAAGVPVSTTFARRCRMDWLISRASFPKRGARSTRRSQRSRPRSGAANLGGYGPPVAVPLRIASNRAHAPLGADCAARYRDRCRSRDRWSDGGKERYSRRIRLVSVDHRDGRTGLG